MKNHFSAFAPKLIYEDSNIQKIVITIPGFDQYLD
jgi:hypothetical protein